MLPLRIGFLSLYGCLLVSLLLFNAPALEARPILQAAPAASQSDDSGWSAPLNLSRSGSASSPLIVADAQEQLHVIWQDAVDGFTYVHGAVDQWSEPISVELPFGTRRFFPDLPAEAATPLFRPRLVADNRDQIHAFWIDDAGALFHSQVPATAFAAFEAWSPPTLLAESVLTLDVTLGSGRALHLGYIRSQDEANLPAGVYYAQLSGDDAGLSLLSLLYPSAYFRSLSSDSANVQIITSGAGHITVAWDNRSLDKVFVAHSANDGESWDSAVELDGRRITDSPDAAGPAHIVVDASGSNVLALWQAAHESLDCTLYYSWSVDGGATWQENRHLEAVPDCPETSNLSSFTGNYSLLMTSMSGTVRLVSWDWDAQQWSMVQTQDALATLLNPDTFKRVSLGCHQAVFATDRLYVVACDAGGGQDIWLMSRQFDEVVEWFPPPPVWDLVQAVPASARATTSLSLVTTGEGRLHAFWQDLSGSSITHVTWDGNRWSQPRVIFTSSTATIGSLSVTASNNDRLHVAWADTQTGQIYVVQAHADQALLESDWSSAIALPQPQPGAWSPDILAGESSRIYVAYAMPINDRRGIYLTWSDDNGDSWTEPVQAFDGAAAGWAMVGHPHLTLTENRQLHLLWTRHTMPGGAGPVALYHARSADGGASWSQPVEIVGAPVTWSEIAATSDQKIHILWKEVDESSTAIHHVFTSDGGVTWSLPATVPTADEIDGPVALAADSSGRLSLLRSAIPAIQHWMWSGERWSRAEDLKLDDRVVVDQIASAILSDGRLGLLLSRQPIDLNDAGAGDTFIFASRPLVAAEANIGQESQPPATAVATASLPQPATIGAAPTPVVTVPAVSFSDSPLPASQDAAVVAGILPAGLVVLLGFVIGLRLVRGGRS